MATSVPIVILLVFWQLLLRNGKISVNLCFETSEHSVQTADGNSKVISQAFRLTLVLYIFKFVLYFNSVIISNQINYYLGRNRGNFLQMQYGFYRHALPLSPLIAYWRNTYQKLKEVNAWNINSWSIMVKSHKLSLFLWQEELKWWMPWELTMNWYLTSWNKYKEPCHL